MAKEDKVIARLTTSNESLNIEQSLYKIIEEKVGILQHCPVKLLRLINNREIVNYKGKELRASYLIDLMHGMLSSFYKTKSKNSTVYRSSKIMAKKYGSRSYLAYLDYLMEHEIIVFAKEAKSKVYCKQFSIPRNILDETTRVYNYDTSIIEKQYNDVLVNSLSSNNVMPYNLKMRLIFNLFNVSIDAEAATQYILKEFNENRNRDDVDRNPLDVLKHNAHCVESILNRDIYFRFDKHGRFHTNYVVLRSAIRKNFLRIDGEELEERDINNSQPLFLTILIQNEYLHRISDLEEFNLFKELTINGKFYEYIMANSKFDREEAKKMIYSVFFGRNDIKNWGQISNDYYEYDYENDAPLHVEEYPNKSKHNKVFKTLFPSIYEFLINYKIENGGYEKLAHVLQNTESKFIFKDVCMRIMNEYPEIKFITIHDSIMFPKKFSVEVNKIFSEEINKLLHTLPALETAA